DAVVHGEVLVGVEVELLDDGLNAGAAEDLLLHGGQPAVDVFGDDGGYKVLRHFLLVDEDQGLRDVLRWNVQGGDNREDRHNERGNGDEPPAALEDCHIIFDVQCAMAKHFFL